jgi:hypothetical protein
VPEEIVARAAECDQPLRQVDLRHLGDGDGRELARDLLDGAQEQGLGLELCAGEDRRLDLADPLVSCRYPVAEWARTPIDSDS